MAAGSPSSPASPKDPGGNPPREPRPQLTCYSCGLPGYIARYCPQGSGNGKRVFIPNYATIAEPLTNLTKKNQKYEWLEEQQRAFELLCAMLMTAPVLHRPDPNGLFVVQTDASDVGLGAVLLQEVEGQERVIEFASHVLTPAERNYSVTERECLAAVWAIQKFAPTSRRTSLKS